MSLLVIQLASSQYSPRVVQTLFRDPYNKRVMALVVGTFTYCVIVLRSVRSPLEQSGHAVIPNLSVAVAVVLGIATILAIVAFINHSAHSMDVSVILERVRHEAVAHVQREWTPAATGTPTSAEGNDAVVAPDDTSSCVTSATPGHLAPLDQSDVVVCGSCVWVPRPSASPRLGRRRLVEGLGEVAHPRGAGAHTPTAFADSKE